MAISKLRLRKISKKLYELKEPLRFEIDGLDWYVPNGFETDLASIPYPINKILKRDNKRYVRSSILHDYLYEIKFNRFESDELFFKAMRIEGSPLIYSVIFYLAVRIFGKIRYNNIKEEN
jgi:hypothetical protein